MTDKQLHLYLKMLIARLRGVVFDIDELEDPSIRGMTPVWINQEKQKPTCFMDDPDLLVIQGYQLGIDFEMQESPDDMNAAALTLDDWLDEFEAEVKELLGD